MAMTADELVKSLRGSIGAPLQWLAAAQIETLQAEIVRLKGERSPKISREELARIKEMMEEYVKPSHPRQGWQTIELYDRLDGLVMLNLRGLVAAAEDGVS